MARSSDGHDESMTAPIRLYMTMSLDGFIAGPDDRAGQELGRNGGRLFNWLDDHIELDLIRTLEAPGVTHLRYRVRNQDS